MNDLKIKLNDDQNKIRHNEKKILLMLTLNRFQRLCCNFCRRFCRKNRYHHWYIICYYYCIDHREHVTIIVSNERKQTFTLMRLLINFEIVVKFSSIQSNKIRYFVFSIRCCSIDFFWSIVCFVMIVRSKNRKKWFSQ